MFETVSNYFLGGEGTPIHFDDDDLINYHSSDHYDSSDEESEIEDGFEIEKKRVAKYVLETKLAIRENESSGVKAEGLLMRKDIFVDILGEELCCIDSVSGINGRTLSVLKNYNYVYRTFIADKELFIYFIRKCKKFLNTVVSNINENVENVLTTVLEINDTIFKEMLKVSELLEMLLSEFIDTQGLE